MILSSRGNNVQTREHVQKRSLSQNVDKENNCFGDDPPPSIRGRKSKDSEHRCGSCTVWLQTGGNQEMLKHHKMDVGRVRHPGERSLEFSQFLSCDGVYSSIVLRSDSCLCDACYRDCLQGGDKTRWLRLSEHALYKHRFLCCEEE